MYTKILDLPRIFCSNLHFRGQRAYCDGHTDIFLVQIYFPGFSVGICIFRLTYYEGQLNFYNINILYSEDFLYSPVFLNYKI